MDVVIRPVIDTDSDFAAIARITNHYIATTAIHFAYEPVRTADLRDDWIAAGARYPWRVAEAAETGDVIAYAKSGTWRNRDAYRWTAEVGLYVDSERRGRGVGKRLYAALLDELDAAGFHSAIGGVTLPND